MFGFKKTSCEKNKNVSNSAAAKFSDNHSPIIKNCFIDTASVWNGRKENFRASDEAQYRLVKFFENQPEKSKAGTLNER